MMPDLPNVGLERDLHQFAEFFENPDFRADGLKIYPTLVIRGTGLYELWKTGRYKSYPAHVLVDLVATILAMVPPWTRVYRCVYHTFHYRSYTILFFLLKGSSETFQCHWSVQAWNMATFESWQWLE